MVDERDEHYDGQEDGEYHFSDDQMNYDEDAEAPKVAGPEAAPVKNSNFKDFILTKAVQHRKILIGTGVFFVLLVVAYKMVMPTATAPSTDFAAAPQAAPAPKTVAKQTPAPQNLPALVNQPATMQPAIAQAADQSAAIVPTGTVMANQAVPPSMPPASDASQTQMPGMTMPSGPAAQQQVAQQQLPPPFGTQEQPVSPMQQAQAAMPAQTATPGGQGVPAQSQAMQTMPVAQPMDGQTKNVSDRIASLEQQNAAIMNLLQTEYAQKISDYETQSTAARGKMEEVTKRLNRMESTLNQITRILENGGASSANAGMMNAAPQAMMSAPASVPSRAAEPKVTYAVQAIISGRAWLKSEGGDTVTVAEGDVLRGYGRITKIDPYDGVVNIDTGNKVITLSYGMNAE